MSDRRWLPCCSAPATIGVDQQNTLAGLRDGFPDTEIVHAAGVAIDGEDTSGLAGAVELCEGAQAIVLCLGEAAVMSGEAASRAQPDLPGRQQALGDTLIC